MGDDLMKKLCLVLLLVAVMCGSTFAGGKNYWGVTTMTIDSNTNRGTLEVSVLKDVNVNGVAGKAILEATDYAFGGFGLDDTVWVVLKSELKTVFSTTTYSLDSGYFTATPCTLSFNNQVDSAFLGDLFFDVIWADTAIADTSASTAITNFNWSIKVWE